MGTLTLTELEDEVRSALGGRTDLDARLPRALNIAQTQIARSHDFFELSFADPITFAFTNTSADNFIQYSVLTNPNPRTIYSIRLIDDAMSRKLTQRTAQQMDDLVPDQEYIARRRPHHYIRWEDALEIWPLPDQQYTGVIRYRAWPTALADGSDLSNFKEKDDILVWLAVSWLFHSLGEYDQAKMFFGMADTHMTSAVREDFNAVDQEIKPAWNDGLHHPSGVPWANPWVDKFP